MRPIGGEVRARVVRQVRVMQRQLACAQRHEFRAALVQLGRDGDGLAVFGVMKLAELVRARDHLHAPGLDRIRPDHVLDGIEDDGMVMGKVQ